MCLFFLNLPFNQLLFLKKYEGGSVFLDLQGPTGSLSEKKVLVFLTGVSAYNLLHSTNSTGSWKVMVQFGISFK